MSKQRAFLLLTILFTLLFIVLVAIGAHLLSVHSKPFAVAAFLFSFAAVMGQIVCLALYLRTRMIAQFLQAAQSSKQR